MHSVNPTGPSSAVIISTTEISAAVRATMEQITLADLAKPIDPAGSFVPLVGLGADTAGLTKLNLKALE